MKKVMLLALALALAVPALGAAAQPSLEDLRTAIFTPASDGAVAPPAAPLQPVEPGQAPAGAQWKSCTVSNDCGPNSPTISCTSATCNATVGATSVTCDGVTTNCAPCHVQTRCANGVLLSCTGTTTTDCDVEPSCFVICSGRISKCTSACP